MSDHARRHRVQPDRHSNKSSPPGRMLYRASVLLADPAAPHDSKRHVLAVSDHGSKAEAEDAIVDHIASAPFGYGERDRRPQVVVASNIYTIKDEEA